MIELVLRIPYERSCRRFSCANFFLDTVFPALSICSAPVRGAGG
jgi:hypothetical protein